MEELVDANLYYLEQASRLLSLLGDSGYAATDEAFFDSSIGQHLRHCLDHYRSFLEGAAEGRINYDKRDREIGVERSTAGALYCLEGVRSDLQYLKTQRLRANQRTRVRMDYGDEECAWQESTFGRELQFLISHTVHHFAMISGIARRMGVVLDPSFGVAPSTLRYRAEAGID
jgi:uncharacterized damage-inducible protein DinB